MSCGDAFRNSLSRTKFKTQFNQEIIGALLHSLCSQLLTLIPQPPPFFVNFPFNVVNGETVLDQSSYAVLKTKFPLHRISMNWQSLKDLRAFGIEYGISDQFMHIPEATAEFSNRLTEYRIPHRLDVIEGDHRNQVASRMGTVILPYVIGVLDPPE